MKLLNAPNIELTESPASWLSRLAMSQSVTLTQLLKHLGLDGSKDLDFAFARRSLPRLAHSLTNAGGNFELSSTIFSRLRQIDPSGEHYLLREGAKPRYRYCLACLAERRTKHFRLEWRFKCWLWCPLHNCYLEERCPHCHSPVVLPVDLAAGGSAREGIPTLEYCAVCGMRLTTAWPNRVVQVDRTRLLDVERCMLHNGRALLSVLMQGCFETSFATDQKIYEFSELGQHSIRWFIPNQWKPSNVADHGT
jgi:rRNA maturation protein Nop10